MNPAKYAQRLKHIRKVKAAIRYQEKTKERLAPIKEENKETKQYILQRLAYNSKQIRGEKRTARKNAEEDWNLGPLRPNRAVGPDAVRHGAFKREQMREPQIPEHWFGAKESVQKRMKTQIPRNVLHDQWHIVKDDRVVVIRGREKNKIGYVNEVLKESNQVTLRDLNKVWVDGRIFSQITGEESDTKREWSHALSYDDVRLVIPYDTYPTINGRVVKMRQDVIVDAVDLEKHTRGTNPFTGEEDERNISEEHQVDPTTEEVIWHRYISGTREPIEWPWEKSEQKKEDEKRRNCGDKGGEIEEEQDVEKSKVEGKGISSFVRTLGGLRKDPKAKEQEESKPLTPKHGDRLERLNPESVTRAKPRERELPGHDDDTTRNLVEILDTAPEYFVPTLVYPPMPNSVIEELRDERARRYGPASKENTAEDRQVARQQAEEAKEETRQKRINSMKTPLQIRWELEQAKKAKCDPTSPPQLPEGLLLALGNHMKANGAKLDKKRTRGAERTIVKINEAREEKAEELLA